MAQPSTCSCEALTQIAWIYPRFQKVVVNYVTVDRFVVTTGRVAAFMTHWCGLASTVLTL